MDKTFGLILLVILLLADISGGVSEEKMSSGGGWGQENNNSGTIRQSSFVRPLSISNDGIAVLHEISLCRPVPTNSWIQSTMPNVTDCGIYTFYLNNFPLNDLPSGGSSGRISSSEMSFMYVKLIDYDGSGYIKMSWYDADTSVKLYSSKVNVPTCLGNCWFLAYSFVGHFSWEIYKPGNYYVFVETSWGNARIDFKVDDSATPTPKPTFTATPPIQATGIVKGDVDGDGAINILDGLFIARSTVGLINLTSEQMAAADANKDGQVDIVDALFIAQYSVGLREL